VLGSYPIQNPYQTEKQPSGYQSSEANPQISHVSIVAWRL
jgi:hypothetical protein